MTEIYSVEVTVTAPVRDTEVTDRVADAIRNVFPNAEPEHRDGELVATVHDLERFSELLHRFEILDTARSALLSAAEGDRFAFDLKKGAAFEGRINFAVGNPSELGDIHVSVRVDQPSVEEYVDHVAPRTEDGEPIDR